MECFSTVLSWDFWFDRDENGMELGIISFAPPFQITENYFCLRCLFDFFSRQLRCKSIAWEKDPFDHVLEIMGSAFMECRHKPLQ